jgi:hypothetical protein
MASSSLPAAATGRRCRAPGQSGQQGRISLVLRSAIAKSALVPFARYDAIGFSA